MSGTRALQFALLIRLQTCMRGQRIVLNPCKSRMVAPLVLPNGGRFQSVWHHEKPRHVRLASKLLFSTVSGVETKAVFWVGVSTFGIKTRTRSQGAHDGTSHHDNAVEALRRVGMMR